MHHEMRLHPEPFDLVKSGLKTTEARLNDPKRQSIHVGDTITFKRRLGETQTLESLVIGRSEFTSFRDLFTAIRQERFGYPVETHVDEMIEDVHTYFTPEQEETFGVVALHLEVIS